MSRRQWTTRDIARLREMSKSGLHAVADAAAEFDVSAQAIHHITRRYGISFRRPALYRTREERERDAA